MFTALVSRVVALVRREVLLWLARGLQSMAVCAALLAFSGAQADSPPVTGFPQTGQYKATYLQTTKHVAAFQLGGNYNRSTPDGVVNVEPRTVLSKEFLARFADKYDFLVVFTNFEFDTGDATAFYLTVKNDTQGLGLPLFDNSAAFGSKGALQGYIDMAALSRYVTEPTDAGFDKVMQTLSHELLHRWAANIQYTDASGKLSKDLLGKDGAHWSFLLDSGGSVEYGNRWVDNGDGSFTSRSVRENYSPLDLYLMGMLKKEEVPPFYLLRSPGVDATRLPEVGVTLKGTRETITIDQVVAANGPRVPDASTSPKQFRLGFVLLTRPGVTPTDDELAAVNNVREAFEQRLGTMTGGRSLVQAFIEPKATFSQGEDPTLPTKTPQTGDGSLFDPAEAYRYLDVRQDASGAWFDTVMTRIRDTAVVTAALDGTGQIPAKVSAAKEWLRQQPISNTDYLARRVMAMNAAYMPADLATLAARQNADGGWGPAQGYLSTPLDTALAVQAFMVDTDTARKALVQSRARTWLLTLQNADGGWSPTAGGASRIATTVQVIRAVYSQNVTESLVRAARFLANRQNLDGGFGDSTSTVHDTASALLAVVQTGQAGLVRSGEAVNYLNQTRTGNSWDSSVYSTSLALQALSAARTYNWQVAAFTATPAQVRDGQRVTLAIGVANSGSIAAPVSSLRFYDGDPTSGRVIATLSVPPLAPGEAVTLKTSWSTTGLVGEHVVTAVADPESLGSEITRGDNLSNVAVTVNPSPKQVDLYASASEITVTPSVINRLPTTINVSALVANIGGTDAVGVKVRLLAGTSVDNLVTVDERTVNLLARSTQPVNTSFVVTRPGKQLLVVVMDPDNTAGDFDVSNNRAQVFIDTTSTFDPSITSADLVVPAQPVVSGSDISLQATLRNLGTADSPPFQAVFSVTDGTTEREIDRNSVQLAAGGAKSFSLPWRVSLLGDLRFKVTLDPAQAVADLDRSNNTASAAFQAVAPEAGINLAVSYRDLSFQPTPLKEGLPADVSVKVRNTGTLPASNVEVALYQGDPAAGGVQVAPVVTLASLAAGGESTVVLHAAAITGHDERLYFVVVDPANKLSERNRGDNQAFQSAAVLSLADLAINDASIDVVPLMPRPGTTASVKVTVQNLGQQDAAQVVVRLLDGGALVAEQTLPMVAAQSSASVSLALPLAAQSGAHALSVVVDPDNAVLEADKSNNTASKILAVQNGVAFVSEAFFSPNGDGIKDTVDFGFQSPGALVTRISIVSEQGQVIRTLVLPPSLQGGVTWDGRDGGERLVPDGAYRIQALAADGTVVGEGTTVVDTNRSPILAAMGTSFEFYRNLSCRIDGLDTWTMSQDEQSLFAFSNNGGVPGIYRISTTDGEVSPVVSASFVNAGADERGLSLLSSSARGERVAFVRTNRSNEQEIWVVNGDGTGLRRVASAADGFSDSPVYVDDLYLSHDGKFLISRHSTLDGRSIVQRIAVDNLSSAVLYDSKNYEDAFPYEMVMAPNRRRVVLRIGTGNDSTLLLIDLETGEVAQAPVGFYQGGSWTGASLKWSPDSRYVVLWDTVEAMGTEPGNTTDYQFDVFDSNFKVVNRFRTTLGKDAGSEEQNGLLSDVDWTGDSMEVVFAHEAPQYGGGQTSNGTRFFYRANVEKGTLSRVAPEDRAWSNAAPIWMAPTGRLSLSNSGAWGTPDYYAVNIDSGVAANAFSSWYGEQNPQGTPPGPLRFTASGRRLLMMSPRDVQNRQSACYQEGQRDQLFAFESLQNLVADVQVMRDSRLGGLLVSGTATDVNFAGYRLEYANLRTPTDWRPMTVPGTEPKIGARLTNWVPPAYGTYLVRMTAQDRAGNTAMAQRRVSWSDSPAIASLMLEREMFSPNGDGVADSVKLGYDVLEPVNLAFEVLNEEGVRVRLAERAHSVAGKGFAFEWDGRDDAGQYVPDGNYKIRVLNFEFAVTVDTVPPELSLTSSDHTFNTKERVLPEGIELSSPETVESLPALDLDFQVDNLVARIVDGLGGVVRQWSFPAPHAHIVWSGDDEEGRDVAEGTYSLDVSQGKYPKVIASVVVEREHSVGAARVTFRPARIVAALQPKPEFTFNVQDRYLVEKSLRVEVGRGNPPADWQAIHQDGQFISVPATMGMDVVKPDLSSEWPSLGSSGYFLPWMYPQARVRVSAEDRAGNSSSETTPFVDRQEVVAQAAKGLRTEIGSFMEPLQAPLNFGVGIFALTTEADELPLINTKTPRFLKFSFLDSLEEEAPRIEFRHTFVKQDKAGRAVMPTAANARALQWVVIPLRGAQPTDLPVPPELQVKRFQDHALTLEWDVPNPGGNGFWLMQLVHRLANGDEKASNIYAYPVSSPLDVQTAWRTYHEPAQVCDGPVSGVQHLDFEVPKAHNTEDPSQPVVSQIKVSRLLADGTYRLMFDEKFDNTDKKAVFNRSWSTLDWPVGRHEFKIELKLEEFKDGWYTETAYVYVDHEGPQVRLLKPSEGDKVCAINQRVSDTQVVRYVPLEVSIQHPFPLIADTQALGAKDIWSLRGPYKNAVTVDVEPSPVSGAEPSPDPTCNTLGICGNAGPVVFPNRVSGTSTEKLKVFGDAAKGGSMPLSGEMTLRARIFGAGGHMVCRPVTVLVDGEVDASLSVDGHLISPNGDGRLDTLTVQVSPAEPVTAKLEVFRVAESGTTGPALGVALRSIQDGNVPTVTERPVVWDGRADDGTVVPDGPYVVRVTLTDDCGNLSIQSYPVDVDVTPPAITFDSPRANSRLSLETPLIGTVTDVHPDTYELEVTLDAVGIPSALPITGRMNLPHSELGRIVQVNGSGPGRVLVRAFDAAGNISELALPVEFAPVGDLIKSLAVTPDVFSPNGDGRRETASMLYTLARSARVTLTVNNAAGQPVVTLINQQQVAAGDRYVVWDGKGASGQIVPDQQLTAVLRAELMSGDTVLTQQEERVLFTVDQTPPVISFLQPAADGSVVATRATVKVTDPLLTTASLEASANGGPYVALAELADVSGSLSASLEPLAEGPAKLRVTASDKAENIATRVLDVIIDRTPPKVALTTPASNAYVSGLKQALAPIEGLIEEANLANYRVTLDNQVLLSATTSPAGAALGTWSPLNVADGPATMKLRAEDRGGLTGEVSVPIVVDNTAPVASLKSSTGVTYLRVGSKILGTAADTNLQQYRVELSAGGVATGRWNEIGRGTAAVTDGALLTATALPPDGVYGLRLTVTDKAGNESVATQDVTVDTTPPTPVTLSVSSANNRDGDVQWTAATQPDAAGYVLYRNGSRINATPMAETRYTDLSLSAGTYLYTVKVVDRAGNESDPSNEGRLLISSSEPVAQIFAPLKDGYAAGLAEVRGTASASADFKEYRLYVGVGTAPTSWQLLRQSPVSVTAAPLATWNTVGASEGGVYTLRLEAENLVGQVARDQVTVKVKNQPPRSPLQLQGTLSDGNNIALTWTASPDEVQGYLLYRDQRLVNATGLVIGSLTPYLIKPTAYGDLGVPDGVHRYQVVAMDAAGNVSDPSNEVEFKLDTRAPDVAITRPADHSKVSVSTPLVAESADTDLATVQFQYRQEGDTSWTNLGGALTQSAGPWTVTWQLEGVPLGTYQVRAVGTDQGGKVDPIPVVTTLVVTDERKPLAPTQVTTRVNGGDVTVTWKASTSSFTTGYYVERMGLWGNAQRLNSEPITGTTYVEAGLGDDTYPYRVVAVTASKIESDPSELAQAVVFTPEFVQPYSPTDAPMTDLTGITRPQHQMALRTETGTLVAQAATDATGAFSFGAIPLALGDNRYQLTAQDDLGNVSRPVTVRVLQGVSPSTPKGLTASVADHRMDLTWQANPESDLLGYAPALDGVSRGTVVQPYDATASSSVNYGEPYRALDGDNATGWQPRVNGSSPAAGQWLQINLSERSLVDAITVRWARPEDVVAAYSIEGFDGEVWVPLAERRLDSASSAQIDPLAEIRFNKPYLTDRLRVKILALRQEPSQYLTQINEVKVNAIQVAAATSATFENVADGRPRVGVRAVSNLGLSSALAEASTAVGDVTPPQAPVLAAAVDGADVRLSWTVEPSDDIAGFRIERDGAVIATVNDATARSYVDPALANGPYTYAVRALDAVGNTSEASNLATAVVAVAGPDASVILKATAPSEGGRVLLDWTVGAGAQPAQFELRRGTAANGPYAVLANRLGGTQRSYVDTSVTNGTRYYYVVVPQDATGRPGNASNEATAFPADRIAPATPYFVLPGRSPGPVSTYEASTTLVGFADPGSTVTVTNGGQSIGTVVANGSTSGPNFYGDSQVFDATADGLLVYYHGYSNSALYRADGTMVPSAKLEGLTNVSALRLAPDGRSAAILKFAGGRASLLRWTREDDSITTLSTEVRDGPLALSPDGRWVAARLLRNGASEERLLLLDWTTGIERELPIQASHLSWSPDSQTLAAATATDGLVLWDLAKGSPRVLAPSVKDGALSWLPDGQSILAEVRDDRGVGAIARVSLADGVVTRLTDDGSGSSYAGPAAAPDGSGFLALRDNYTLVRRGFDGSESMINGAVGGYGAPLWTRSGNIVYLQSWNSVMVLSPEGQFVLSDVPLALGAQQFGAFARDDAGNGSGMAMELEVRRLSDKLPDWQVTTDSWQVYPATPQVGERVNVALTVTNVGADAPATDVSAVVVDAAGNATTVFSAPVPALARGAQAVVRGTWAPSAAGRYVLVGSVDTQGAVTEQSEDNNLASREVLVVTQGNRPELSLATDKSRYAGGDVVAATATAVYSGASMDGQVRLRVVDTGGYEVTNLTPKPVAGLAFGAPKLVNFSWPSGSTLADTYRLIAELTDNNGTVLASAQADVVLDAGAQLSAQLTTDHADYLRNDNVNVQGQLAFLSGNVASLDVPARLTISNAAGVVVASQVTNLTGLLPGSQVRLDLAWTADQAGDYTAVLSAGPVEAPTAQAQSAFRVGLPSAPLLQGRLQVAGDVFNTNEVVQLQYSVANRGAVIDPLPVRVTAVQAGAGGVLASAASELTGVGSTAQSRAAQLSGTWPQANFEIRLEAQVQGVWTLLDKTTVRGAEQQVPGIGFLSPVAEAVVRSSAGVSLQVTARQAPIAKVELQLGDGPWTPAQPFSVTEGRYAGALPTVDGEVVVKARAVDTKGQMSSVPQLHLVIDNTAPVIAIAGIADGVSYREAVTPVVTITELHPASRQVLLDGVPFESGTPVSAAGAHVLSVTATDAAGNASQAQVTFNIVTATPPTAVFVAPAEGAVVQSRVGVTAQAQASQGSIARAELQVGDGAWVAMVGSNGVFTGALPSQDGTVLLKLRATDTQGGVSLVAQRSVVVDNTAPVIAISGVADGSTTIGSATPVVQVTDLHPGSNSLTLDGAAYVSGTTVTAVGNHVLAVSATDAAGNTAQRSVSFSITAATGPVASFVSPTADAIVRSAVGVTAQATSSQDKVLRAELQVGEGAWTAMAGTAPSFTGSLPSADGIVVLRLRAYDSRGLVSEVVQRSVTIDNTAPVITVSGVTADGSYVSSATPVITIAEAHPGSTKLLMDGATYLSGTAVTAVGSHVLSVESIDVAGNTAKLELSFTIKAATVPTVAFATPAANAVVKSSVGVVAQAASEQDSIAKVELQLGTGAWMPMVAQGSGRYSGALPTADGAVLLRLRATDSRGLVSSVVERSVVVDNTPPALSVSGVVDGTRYTVSVTPVVTITEANPGSSQITLDGVIFSSGTKVTALGSHVLAISATDAAGNTAQRSVSFTVEADSLPAQPAVITPTHGEPGRLLVYVACTRTADEGWNDCYQQISRGYDDEKAVWACTVDRAAWLRDYLNKRGVEATVVTDEGSFLYELRSGRYGSYWVGGGALVMGSLATAELQAAVRRGESLITEGWRPGRNDGMQYLAGLTSATALSSDTASVTVSSGDLPASKLLVYGPVRVTTASGVTVPAKMTTAAVGAPAIVVRPFGSGRVVSFAFDLSRSLREKSATDSSWNDLVAAALKLIAPAPKPSVVAGGVTDIRSAVSNKAAVGLELELVTKTPSDMSLLSQSPTPTSVKVEGGMPTVRWNATLPAGTAKTFSVVARAPDTRAGSFVVTSLVNVKKSGGSTLSDTQTVTLKVVSTDDMIDAAYDATYRIKGLAATLPKLSALGWLATAKTSGSFCLWQDALRQLIAAQASLQNVTGDGAEEAKYAIARAIEAVERRL